MAESVEDYYARILAATDTGAVGGRLPVSADQMPGWDIFPYEVDSLRLKPMQALLDTEPPRFGEDSTTCRCVSGRPDAGVFFFGRPARAGQFRGSPLLDWEENLPKVPDQGAAENARFVAERLVAAYGGRAHPAPLPE